MDPEEHSILIVEDEYLIAVDTKLTLEDAGYSVGGIAASGRDALSMFQSLKPDLVLMDIVLTGTMDGISAAEIIRQQSNVPVIFVSGNIDEKNTSRIRQLERCTWVSKPCDALRLRDVIRKVFTGEMPEGTLPV